MPSSTGAAPARARRDSQSRPRRPPRPRAGTERGSGRRGPSSAFAGKAREMRGEIIRLDVTDEPECAALAAFRAEERGGRRAIDAEAAEKSLVRLAVGRDVGLQQHEV